jgi:hypothetical protein
LQGGRKVLVIHSLTPHTVSSCCVVPKLPVNHPQPQIHIAEYAEWFSSFRKSAISAPANA